MTAQHMADISVIHSKPLDNHPHAKGIEAPILENIACNNTEI